ncbi:MAG: general stress protein CsbD [Saprospiraceae bacterium]|nr:general stress protein CsbD [Saprospiraceae bacterium]
MKVVRIKGNWIEQKSKLKKKYSNLTEADFEFVDGKKKSEMFTKLQVTLGMEKRKMHKMIDAL